MTDHKLTYTGVNLTVYFLIMQGLWSSKHHSTIAMKKFHAVFSTVMILLLTIDVSVTAIWGEEMWIVRRDAPGGIPLFILTENSIWYSTLGTICTFIIVLLADIFLVSNLHHWLQWYFTKGTKLYRLYVIFEASYLVVTIPCLALLAAFGKLVW